MFKTLLLLFLILVESCFALNNSQKQNVSCLAQVIYHEARGEIKEGRIAVGSVVINRYHTGQYISLCAVIHRPGQFVWVTLHKPILEKVAWIESQDLARALYLGQVDDNTKGSLFFKEKSSKRPWPNRLLLTVSIGNHLFYRYLV